MSRLQYDESYWAKEGRIVRKFKVDRDVIFSSIGRLWHNSQEDKISICSEEDLLDLMEASDRDEELQRLLIDGFLHVGFLSVEESEDGEISYRISGNDDHIGSIEHTKLNTSERAKRAAETMHEQRRAKEEEERLAAYKKIQKSAAQALAQAAVADAQAGATAATRQGRAEQGMSDQNKAGQDNLDPQPSFELELVTPENLDQFDTADPRDFVDGVMRPDVVFTLWSKYITPVTKLEPPDYNSMSKRNWEKIDSVLKNSVLALPGLSTWVAYFELIRKGDWHSERRSSFSFASVIKLENIKTEFAKKNRLIPTPTIFQVTEGEYAQ